MAAPGDPTGPPGAAIFDAFVREYQDMVYAVALRLLANEADAEDVAQATFVRAYEHFGRLQPATVAGWLRTVATHLALNHLARHRSRWRLFSEAGAADAPALDAASDAPGPAEILDEEERRARLGAALRALPSHQRVPLVLFHFEQRPYDDIARLLGVTLGKLKTDMHRGRLALRQWLG